MPPKTWSHLRIPAFILGLKALARLLLCHDGIVSLVKRLES